MTQNAHTAPTQPQTADQVGQITHTILVTPKQEGSAECERYARPLSRSGAVSPLPHRVTPYDGDASEPQSRKGVTDVQGIPIPEHSRRVPGPAQLITRVLLSALAYNAARIAIDELPARPDKCITQLTDTPEAMFTRLIRAENVLLKSVEDFLECQK